MGAASLGDGQKVFACPSGLSLPVILGGLSVGQALNKKNLQHHPQLAGCWWEGKGCCWLASHLACRTDPANISGEGMVLVGAKLTSCVL